jgi:hypothetical protein
VSKLSAIKTQLWWNKLSTHMVWQTTAVTSHTMLPWWFHTPHTFITMNICSTILSRNSKYNMSGKLYSSGIHIFSKCIFVILYTSLTYTHYRYHTEYKEISFTWILLHIYNTEKCFEWKVADINEIFILCHVPIFRWWTISDSNDNIWFVLLTK